METASWRGSPFTVPCPAWTMLSCLRLCQLPHLTSESAGLAYSSREGGRGRSIFWCYAAHLHFLQQRSCVLCPSNVYPKGFQSISRDRRWNVTQLNPSCLPLPLPLSSLSWPGCMIQGCMIPLVLELDRRCVRPGPNGPLYSSPHSSSLCLAKLSHPGSRAGVKEGRPPEMIVFLGGTRNYQNKLLCVHPCARSCWNLQMGCGLPGALVVQISYMSVWLSRTN